MSSFFFSPWVYLTSFSLKFDLPFGKDTFDLVRMANLTLCIPYDRWEFVFGQVRRVLAPLGRLEVIDDQIFYPYDKMPVPPQMSPVGSRLGPALPTGSAFYDSDDDYDSEDDLDEGIYADSSSEYSDSTPEFPTPLPDPYDEWESHMNNSKDLETLFVQMLQRKYRIHPRPFEFIRICLRHIFGKRYVHKVTTKHLSLAPSDNASSDADKESDRASLKSSDSGFASASPSNPGLSKKPWITIDWDKKDKKGDKTSSPDNSPPGMVNVLDVANIKAASILGIKYRPPYATLTRTQSPGLVVWPSTIIELTPSELEMHVCKHMHVLLGCKVALAEYIADCTDRNGKRLIGDQEFEDMIWEYEWFVPFRFVYYFLFY